MVLTFQGPPTNQGPGWLLVFIGRPKGEQPFPLNPGKGPIWWFPKKAGYSWACKAPWEETLSLGGFEPSPAFQAKSFPGGEHRKRGPKFGFVWGNPCVPNFNKRLFRGVLGLPKKLGPGAGRRNRGYKRVWPEQNFSLRKFLRQIILRPL